MCFRNGFTNFTSKYSLFLFKNIWRASIKRTVVIFLKQFVQQFITILYFSGGTWQERSKMSAIKCVYLFFSNFVQPISTWLNKKTTLTNPIININCPCTSVVNINCPCTSVVYNNCPCTSEVNINFRVPR